MKRNMISIIALILSVILLIVSLQFYLDTRRHLLIETLQSADSTRSSLSTPEERSEISEDLQNFRETAITEAISIASPAITGIHVTRIKQYTNNPFFTDPFFSRFFPNNVYKKKIQSLGSGVLISPDGYLVTNAHVLGDNAVEVYATLMGGARYPATVIGADPLTDIALLKIDVDSLSFPYIKLGNSEEIIIGEWVIALGNPFGLFNVSNKPIVTAGIISSIHMDFGETESGHVYQDMIQTDASINSGNSGGALVNMSGELIGINTFIFNGNTGNSGSIGIGFAIPINRVKQIVDDLQSFGEIPRNWDFGISGQPLTQSIIDYYKLDTDHGIIVTNIQEGKAGDLAGLQIGDIILSINDQSVKRNQDVINIINNSYLKIGDRITALVNRDGTEFSIEIELNQ